MTERITRFGLSITLGAGLLAFVAVPAFSAPGSDSKHESQAAETQTQKLGKDQESIGQKKFNQNCSRCHKAPQAFPPNISGTILKHMRVRASLSQQDERDILRFLNP